MARFYTSATNSRGNTTTAQGRGDGQSVHTRGWTAGIRIESRPSGLDDVFEVYATSGSRGGKSDLRLGTLRVDATGRRTWEAEESAYIEGCLNLTESVVSL